MSIILNLCYAAFLLAVSPVILWRVVLYGKYRSGLRERFFGPAVVMPKKTAPRLWFQAVSVGEVNLLKPIFRQIAADHPDWELVVSATSQTGYELAKKTFPDKTVFRCPLDFSWATNRAMRRIRPDLLVLAELELWPNLIWSARAFGAKTAIVNGRISDGSFSRYRKVRFFFKRLFRSVDLTLCGSNESNERFAALGVSDSRRVTTGSMKFDGVATDRNNPKTLALAAIAGIGPDDTVFLAGSTQEPEEALALETYRTLAETYPNLRLILVPRHPQRFDAVAEILNDSALDWVRRSALDGSKAIQPKARILLVDTVGELGAWWGTAQIAFVGGSMGSRGGQNMLEPAGYGAAVSFGPHTKNFREITEAILRADAAQVVADGAQLTAFVRRALDEPAFAERLGKNAQNLVLAQRGATKKTVDLLAELLHKKD